MILSKITIKRRNEEVLFFIYIISERRFFIDFAFDFLPAYINNNINIFYILGG